jgi:hypothetical protein
MTQYDLCVSLILRGVFGTWGVGIFLSRPPTRLIADSADASVSSESSTSLAEEGGTDTMGISLLDEERPHLLRLAAMRLRGRNRTFTAGPSDK